MRKIKKPSPETMHHLELLKIAVREQAVAARNRAIELPEGDWLKDACWKINERRLAQLAAVEKTIETIKEMSE